MNMKMVGKQDKNDHLQVSPYRTPTWLIMFLSIAYSLFTCRQEDRPHWEDSRTDTQQITPCYNLRIYSYMQRMPPDEKNTKKILIIIIITIRK